MKCIPVVHRAPTPARTCGPGFRWSVGWPFHRAGGSSFGLALGFAVGLAFGLAPVSLRAQNQGEAASTAESDSAAASAVTTGQEVSPGGAFLRSMLLPGWGQASVGAYNRAGFYFGIEATSAWMFLKTVQTLSTAREVVTRVEAEATARLLATGTSDLQEIANALDEDESVTAARELVGVRSQQREDWLAFGLFMLLIGGADAFVAGHLENFPDALQTDFRLTPGGALEAEVSVRLPRHE